MSDPAVLLLIPVGIAGILLFDSLLLAYCFRARKGRFEVQRDDDQALVAVTDIGRVTINRQKALFSVGSAAPVPLARLERLDYSLRSEWAAAEEWLMGVDLWDHWKRYQDHLHWHTVAVCPAGSARIPVFVVGEYEPKEPLLNWSGFLEAHSSAFFPVWGGSNTHHPMPWRLSIGSSWPFASRGWSCHSARERQRQGRASSERRRTMQ